MSVVQSVTDFLSYFPRLGSLSHDDLTLWLGGMAIVFAVTAAICALRWRFLAMIILACAAVAFLVLSVTSASTNGVYSFYTSIID